MQQKIKHTIGLGTAAIGRPQYINVRNEAKASISLDEFRRHGKVVLDTAYDRGVRYFDTAPGYGMAEDLLLEWVGGKADSTIEVATKWGYTYTADFQPDAKVHEVKEHSLEKLKAQWAVSQKLMPYLSTYQIHSATLETGVLENEKILQHLSELKAAHRLFIGITTTGMNQVEVIKKAVEVEVNGEYLFDAFQVTFNMLDQSLLEILPVLNKLNKRIIIKEALANGRLFPNQNYPAYSRLYDQLNWLSRKYEVGIDAIALRFCLDSVRPYMVLSGASMAEHLFQNLKTHQFELEGQDLEMLASFKVKPEAYWAERKKLGWN